MIIANWAEAKAAKQILQRVQARRGCAGHRERVKIKHLRVLPDKSGGVADTRQIQIRLDVGKECRYQG